MRPRKVFLCKAAFPKLGVMTWFEIWSREKMCARFIEPGLCRYPVASICGCNKQSGFLPTNVSLLNGLCYKILWPHSWKIRLPGTLFPLETLEQSVKNQPVIDWWKKNVMFFSTQKIIHNYCLMIFHEVFLNFKPYFLRFKYYYII